MRKIVLDPVQLREMVEVQGLQHHKIAELLGVSRDTVGRSCKAHGLQCQRTGPRSGPEHTGWKGGRKIVKGYVYLYAPDHPNCTKQGYVAEHRLAMEKKLGRLLTRKEVVHHRNEVPADNSPRNLESFPDNPAHLKATRSGRIPNWTAEGKERIQQGLRKRATQIRSGVGVPQRNQTTGQWIATPDKPSPKAS